METSEVEKHLNEFEKVVGIQEYLLKYPVDMLLSFDLNNIKEKIEENIKQIFKFETLFLTSEARYLEMQALYDETLSEQFDWYKFEYDRSLSTQEIKEFYIRKDPKVKQVKRLLDKQKIQRDFFKLCISSFLRQGERMHDYIKVLEIKNNF